MKHGQKDGEPKYSQLIIPYRHHHCQKKMVFYINQFDYCFKASFLAIATS